MPEGSSSLHPHERGENVENVEGIMEKNDININSLIKVIRQGGRVRTGVDIYNAQGVLLLEKDALVTQEKTLHHLKESGISTLSITNQNQGGLWDVKGKPLLFTPPEKGSTRAPLSAYNVETKIKEITEIKKNAARTYEKTKTNIKKVILDIKNTGGEFDYDSVETTISTLLDFMNTHDNAFAYLTKEILSFDDYLYNHSINVCTIATAILKQFNDHFSSSLNEFIISKAAFPLGNGFDHSFTYYLSDEIYNISIGYFLHDIGKVLIPIEILNKKGRLTPEEFDIIKTHSFKKGVEVMEKNHIDNPFITNSVRYHHAALFSEEQNCYPVSREHHEIPMYVKICKLADIYDAMTSKRSYKEAINPINVVATIFHKYARKDPLLQFILHSFVKCIGIHPSGSIVFLNNGQMAYVIESKGPILIPFTDEDGISLKVKPNPIDLGEKEMKEKWALDNSRSPITPVMAYDKLPKYLRDLIYNNMEP